MITGETYIGTTTGSSLPTGTQLTNYVQTEAGRDPKPGDYVYFILQISGATDKNYKYIYSAVTGWNGSEIPALEEAGNGSLGIIEGTYNVGDTSNTLVDIVGGKIKNIYVKDGDGNYRNIREYSNALKSTIEGIIDGTYVVGYANKAYKDGDGNTITSTYMTQTAGATKLLVVDGENGAIYNDDNCQQLVDIVEKLAKDRKETERIGLNAYKTIRDLQNAKVAATRFSEVLNKIVEKQEIPSYDEGPMKKMR